MNKTLARIKTENIIQNLILLLFVCNFIEFMPLSINIYCIRIPMSLEFCNNSGKDLNQAIPHNFNYWIQKRQSVNSHREEAQLINILIWRLNTTMPILRIKNYNIISQKAKYKARQFPKLYSIVEENIPVKINQVHGIELSEAIYFITEMIMGYQAIFYKFRKCNFNIFSCGLNSDGELRINLGDYNQAHNNINERCLQPFQLIKEVFQGVSKLVTQNISRQLLKYLQQLSFQPHLTCSSAVLLIREKSHKNGVVIPANLSRFITQRLEFNRSVHSDTKLQGYVLKNLRKQRQPLAQNSISKLCKSEFFSDKNLLAQQTTCHRNNSVCLSQQIRRSPLNSINKQKPKVHWSYTSCTNFKQDCKSVGKTLNKKQVSLAYSMFIKPSINLSSEKNLSIQSNAIQKDHSYEHQIRQNKLKIPSKNQIIQLKRNHLASQCFSSYVTTAEGSQSSQCGEIFKNQTKLSRQNYYYNQQEKHHPFTDIEQHPSSKQVLESHVIQKKVKINDERQKFTQSLKSRLNCISMVIDEEKIIERESENEQSFHENFTNIFSPNFRHKFELNESFSVSESPEKQSIKIKISPCKQARKIASRSPLKISDTKEQIIKEQEIWLQNGWKNQIKLFGQFQNNLKQSMHCGSDSYLPLNAELTALKLSKLGGMGRLIGTSLIPEGGWN